MKKIIPSIIARNQKELDKIIKKVSFAPLMQIDIMDGKFVKNKSFDFDFTLPKKKYEAHLMVKDPISWIKKHGKKVNTIYFHYEAVKNHIEVIKEIRKIKKKVGIAINPKTKVDKIKKLIKYVDNVLIMTVYPGKYGAKFLPFTTKKIQELKKYKVTIEVDGGISNKTITQAKDANLFISGSYLLKSPKVNHDKLKRLLK